MTRCTALAIVCTALFTSALTAVPWEKKTPESQSTRRAATNMAFYKVVQPVLDEHCVRCHSDTKPAGRLDLTGDRTRYSSMAHDGLWERGMITAARKKTNGEQGRGAEQPSSPLARIAKHIDGTHYDVKLKDRERRRIETWIGSDLDYHGIPGRDKRPKLDDRDPWADPWFAKKFMTIYREKCESCHGKELGTEPYPKRSAWINLSRPKHSRVLLAHLAKGEGGWGIDKEVDKRRPPIFDNADDATYRAILEALEEGRRRMLTIPRADAPAAKMKKRS